MKILIRLALLSGLFLLTPYLKAQSSPPDLVVYFASDSYVLSPQEKLRIDSFLTSVKLKGKPDFFYFKGHTDGDGSEAYNDTLASRRLDAVFKIIQPLEFVSKVVGEANPVKPNDVEGNKRWNRRVEIWVEYEEKEKVPHINTVLTQCLKYQQFCINPSRDTLIIGEDGTILSIPANSFKYSAQTSCLTIRLREFLSIEDMLMARLSTTSNGSILESGGMIYVDAINDRGEQVELKNEASIHISIPTRNPVPGMEVFYGHQDSTGHINWDGNSNTPMPAIQPNGLFGSIFCSYPEGDWNYCPVFFCGVRKFFRRVMGKPEVISLSRSLRSDCERLTDSLFRAYGVTNYKDYLLAVNKDLMDSLNLKTYSELQSYLAVKAEEERRQRLQNGDVSNYELSYYAFNTSRLGFINCDRFSDLNNRSIATLRIKLDNPLDYHVCIVFPKIKSILNANAMDKNGMVVFGNIPTNTSIHVVAMKHLGNGMVDLCIQKANTSDDILSDFKFERVSVDDLPEKLAGL